MAQIRIEQRRSGTGWLWLIIALIIVAVIVWFLATGAWRSTTAPARTNDTAPSSLEGRPTGGSGNLPAAAQAGHASEPIHASALAARGMVA